jgi:hypothetical protein
MGMSVGRLVECPRCDGSGEVRGEFWIVEAVGKTDDRSLNYWGPYATEAEARSSTMFRTDGAHYVVGVAT